MFGIDNKRQAKKAIRKALRLAGMRACSEAHTALREASRQLGLFECKGDWKEVAELSTEIQNAADSIDNYCARSDNVRTVRSYHTHSEGD